MSTATITAREANQQFAKLLRQVAQGKEFLVTLRGKPVARIAPAVDDGTRVPTPEQEAAWQRILATKWHLSSRDEPFDRESLHERR